MSDSRYPSTSVFDYCFHPVHLVKDDGRDLLVPCGKCAGCLLHRSNDWSMRIGTEIENTPGSLFFTLTYSNYYLPKLKLVKRGIYTGYTWDNEKNMRFDGVKDKLRVEPDIPDFIVCRDYIPIQNFYDPYREYIPYSSKRDVQLMLKILRKFIINHFNYDRERTKRGLFRYYIISEYGPTTFRPHLHGLIFPSDLEISSFISQCGLYAAWKMCIQDEFDVHVSDSGARGYVSNYVTRYSALPSVYKDNKELQPFRLASKHPAIGYGFTSDEKIYNDVSVGTLEYHKDIVRLGESVLVQYPKNYMSRLFPKCYRYNALPSHRVLAIYSCIWRAMGKLRRWFDIELSLFRAFLHPMNYAAALACYNYCLEYHTRPEHYLYLLDMYYYKRDMGALRMMYEYEQKKLSTGNIQDKLDVLRYVYSNSYSFLVAASNNFGFGDYYVSIILESFGLNEEMDRTFRYLRSPYQPNSVYVAEVSDIVANMEKSPKYNESHDKYMYV